MGALATGFEIATLASFGLGVAAYRVSAKNADIAGLGLMLLADWVVCHQFRAAFSFDDAHGLYPIVDVVCMAVAGVAWVTDRGPWLRRVWKLALAFCYLTQLCVNLAYQGNLNFGIPPLGQWNYVLLLNILKAMQLACVIGPGGWYVGAWLVHLGGDLLVRRDVADVPAAGDRR